MPRSVYLFFLISSLSILNSEAHFLTIPDHLQYFWESTKGDCPNVALTGELCINSLGTDKMFPSKFLKYTDDPYKRYQFDECDKTDFDFQRAIEFHSGSDGQLYRIKQISTNHTFIYKKYTKRESDFEKERNVLSVCANHPHIIQVECQIDSENGLMYENLELGDSQTFITPNTTYEDIKLITAGMISAIHHVHRKGYIHLDLKSMNIGLDRNGILKIFDFGLSHKMTQHMWGVGTPLGQTPENAEIEGYEYQPRHEGLDYWGAGTVVWYNHAMPACKASCILNIPFPYDTRKVWKAKFKDQFCEEQCQYPGPFWRYRTEDRKKVFVFADDFPTYFPDELCELLEKLLEMNSNDRRFSTPLNKVDELLSLPYFDGIDWNNIVVQNPKTKIIEGFNSCDSQNHQDDDLGTCSNQIDKQISKFIKQRKYNNQTLPLCQDEFIWGEMEQRKMLKDGQLFNIKMKSNKKNYIYHQFKTQKEFKQITTFHSWVNHPNILKPVCQIKEDQGVIMQELPKGDLTSIFQKLLPINDNHVKYYVAKIIEIMHQIHSKGYFIQRLHPSIFRFINKKLMIVKINQARQFHRQKFDKLPYIDDFKNYQQMDKIEVFDWWQVSKIIQFMHIYPICIDACIQHENNIDENCEQNCDYNSLEFDQERFHHLYSKELKEVIDTLDCSNKIVPSFSNPSSNIDHIFKLDYFKTINWEQLEEF